MNESYHCVLCGDELSKRNWVKVSAGDHGPAGVMAVCVSCCVSDLQVSLAVDGPNSKAESIIEALLSGKGIDSLVLKKKAPGA